jgi:polyhydroxyalkanoate synthesis regulator phasin
MGWGRMFLLGDWGQQMDIEDQRRRIRELGHEVRQHRRTVSVALEKRIDDLEQENDNLKLHLAALVRYCIAKGTIDVEEFKQFVDAIDESDGEADGKYVGDIV